MTPSPAGGPVLAQVEFWLVSIRDRPSLLNSISRFARPLSRESSYSEAVIVFGKSIAQCHPIAFTTRWQTSLGHPS